MAEHTSIRSGSDDQHLPRSQNGRIGKDGRSRIAAMIREGLSGKSIAATLGIAQTTVSKVRRAIVSQPKSLPGEDWRPVVGMESRYAVSNLGRVRHDFNSYQKPIFRVMAPSTDSCGYKQACLYVNGKQRSQKVHRLVAAAFIGPCPEGKEVNHINGVKADNRAKNLEYVTASQNCLHALRTGLMVPVVGEKHHNAKLSDREVDEIRRLLGMGVRGAKIARRFNTSGAHVSRIKFGISRAAHSTSSVESESDRQIRPQPESIRRG